MSIYILLLLYGYFFSLLELSTNNKKKDERLLLFFAYIFFSFLLVILQGFRGEVGNDYLAYRNYFESPNVMDNNFEIGFKYLVYFCKTINISYNLFQLIMAFFIGVISYSYIYKKTKYPIFFLFVYFCIFFFPINFSQIRQQIAICILMLFSLINKKKSKIIIIIGCFLAATFHKTCLILVIVPLLKIIMKKKSKVILYCLLCIAVIITVYAQFFFGLTRLLTKIPFLPPVILDVVYYYTQEMNKVGIGAGVYASYILCFIIILFSDRDYKKTFYFAIAFLLDKAGFFVVVIQRFSYYFYLYKLGIESYTNVIENKIIKGNTKILTIFLLLTYFFLINLRYMIDARDYIIPYRFF